MATRVDSVRIQTRDQVIEMPWKASQQLRGRLLAAGLDSLEEQFAAKGTSAPIFLDGAERTHRRPPLGDLLGSSRAATGSLLPPSPN